MVIYCLYVLSNFVLGSNVKEPLKKKKKKFGNKERNRDFRNNSLLIRIKNLKRDIFVILDNNSVQTIKQQINA